MLISCLGEDQSRVARVLRLHVQAFALASGDLELRDGTSDVCLRRNRAPRSLASLDGAVGADVRGGVGIGFSSTVGSRQLSPL